MPIVSPLGESPLVHSVLLCSWDHIFGPLLEHAWCHRRDTACFQYVARQSLDGEIFMEHPAAEAQSKLAVYPEFGVLAKGVTFTATPDATGPTVFALTLVMPQACQPLFLALYGELEARVRVLAGRAKVFLDASARTAVRRLSAELAPLVRDLNSLAGAVAGPAPPRAGLALLSGRAAAAEVRFLAVAATAMLQSMGRAVLVGRGEAALATYVATLGHLLAMPGRRGLVRAARPDDNRHVPGLGVQAVLNTGQQRLYTNLERSLLGASQPSAVVDLDRRQVMRCPPAHEFYSIRRDFLAAVCEDHLRGELPEEGGTGGDEDEDEDEDEDDDDDGDGGDGGGETAGSEGGRKDAGAPAGGAEGGDAGAGGAEGGEGGAGPCEALFWARMRKDGVSVLRPVRRAAPCVEAMILQALEVPPAVRGAVLAQSMRLLQRRGSMLLAQTEHAVAQLPKPPSLAAYASLRAQLRRETGLASSEDDFAVYVAMAETFRPGLHRMLYGDPVRARARAASAFGGF